ncbi:hypothetical protein B0H14DRAFT_3131881 [Mycena olivaceomarginata]|nr:hypothetical protein B0H14DRAFT_3131881 [Mycena olivaceomarginata]
MRIHRSALNSMHQEADHAKEKAKQKPESSRKQIQLKAPVPIVVVVVVAVVYVARGDGGVRGGGGMDTMPRDRKIDTSHTRRLCTLQSSSSESTTPCSPMPGNYERVCRVRTAGEYTAEAELVGRGASVCGGAQANCGRRSQLLGHSLEGEGAMEDGPAGLLEWTLNGELVRVRETELLWMLEDADCEGNGVERLARQSC